MLPARNRASKTLFGALRVRGTNAKKLEGAEFRVFFAKDELPLKVGIVVSKKIAKKAVVRNRIKRKVAESLKDEIGKMKGGLLIIVKKEISTLKTEQIKGKLLGMLQKLDD